MHRAETMAGMNSTQLLLEQSLLYSLIGIETDGRKILILMTQGVAVTRDDSKLVLHSKCHKTSASNLLTIQVQATNPLHPCSCTSTKVCSSKNIYYR